MADQAAPPEPDVVEGEVVEDAQPDQPGTALAAVPQAPATLFHTDDPLEVVDRAERVATRLKDVLEKQKLIANISGKGHVQVEGWQLLGSMLGIFPILVWTKPVLDRVGHKIGWEAKVEARTRAGEIVGSAEAECLETESRWADAEDYARRSMAQTRATSKALKGPLGFVVTLAGYSSTPAEEMDGVRGSGGGQRQGKSDGKPTIKNPGEPASQKQVGMASAIAGKLGLEDKARLDAASEVVGRQIKSYKDLTKGEASKLIDALDARLKASEAGGGGGSGESSADPSVTAPAKGSPPPPQSSELTDEEATEWRGVLEMLEKGELDEEAQREEITARAAAVLTEGNRSRLLRLWNEGHEEKARSVKLIPVAGILKLMLRDQDG